jgi:hypothetical protein
MRLLDTEIEAMNAQRTASSGAFLPGQSRMVLCKVGSSQLTENDREKSSEDEQTRSRHVCRIVGCRITRIQPPL